MTVPDVELDRVVKRYDDFTAVADCSLAVTPGEFITLLGPSGCGKTTTLNMIAGFFPPTHGTIKIRGNDVTGLPPNKRRVGMVFQNYALFPHLTVEKNVSFGLRMRGASKSETERAAREALEKVHMEAFADRFPRQLSGGQQQRIALARAVAPQPSVLLLDEPLSNLDLKLRESMRRELKSLQQDLGVTAVFVTHDQDEALTMSDRIVVMNAGRIEQIGTPAEIYAKPRSRFVGAFVGQMNFFDGHVANDRAAGKQIVMDGNGGRLAVPSSVSIPSDRRVHFGIRPEAIGIVAKGEPNAEGAVIEGYVEDVVLAGPIFQLFVRVGDSNTIRVDLLNLQAGGRHAIGDQVSLKIDPDDLIVFTE